MDLVGQWITCHVGVWLDSLPQGIRLIIIIIIITAIIITKISFNDVKANAKGNTFNTYKHMLY